MTARTSLRFGQEIRRRRQALGWTLEQFAEACKLTPNYLGTIETGKRDVHITTLFAIARALQCTAGDLLSDPETDLSAAACDIGRQFEETSPDAQEAVAYMLRTVAKQQRKEKDESSRRRGPVEPPS